MPSCGRVTLERAVQKRDNQGSPALPAGWPWPGERGQPKVSRSSNRDQCRQRHPKEQKKILLLEDDPNLGFLRQENLELLGFQMRRCVNGLKGAAACRETALDLCVVDLMMPRQDGFTFAAELRQRDQHTPHIFLSAKSLKEDKFTGFNFGYDG